jgi:hypothetical protein
MFNNRGYERAVNGGARYMRLVVAAMDTMNQKNANALPDHTCDRCIVGCPFEGAVSPELVCGVRQTLSRRERQRIANRPGLKSILAEMDEYSL